MEEKYTFLVSETPLPASGLLNHSRVSAAQTRGVP